MSSSTTDPGSRSAAEIEREVEQTRAGLTSTLDELRERASPGQLFEQAVDYVRSSGGNEFVRNLGTSVRDNPLPLLLIGAGIGWLMMSGSGRQGGTAPSMAASPDRTIGAGSTRVRVYGGDAGSGGSMAGRASEAVGAARDSVAGAADQAIEKAGQAYRSVGDAVGAVADSLRGATASVTDQVAGSGQAVQARAGELGDQARQGATWLMREQPLVLGAIGVALGAAVGALLPGTEAEDRLMGETRDAVADRVQASAEQGYERLKDTAGEHLDHAKAAVGQAASGQGGVGAALTDAAREVRQAASDAAHDLAGEARGAIEGQPRRDEGPAPAPAPGSPRVGPV
ncbi:DUF3618 domain-containing protein [Dankookia rubra]|uniref:DUF3618 domain-containing protein n=1 Tax=Dankookia rubra TaxID=1442381 RepID=A0A4R5QD77_9PROT|nr:DUF3618 domain-containing protein [Dankookia rubra]TDH60559.1 DUF3618 domain-containing protein [Dankookia rubra]